jgi:NADH-quinone oxidoreductase subunit C
MEEKQIIEKIKTAFSDAAFELVEENTDHPYLVVPPDKLVEICRFLKEEKDLHFDSLANLSGVDNKEMLTTVYHLFSYEHAHFCVLKVNTPRETPEMPTIEGVWPGANWFEREVYDLFGIVFTGHSDLRRIMLPEDWVGHPLRKDYEEQEEYHGMGTTRTPLVKEPPPPVKPVKPAPKTPPKTDNADKADVRPDEEKE